MTSPKFDLSVRKALRQRPIADSAMLEALEFADAEVDRLEKVRATTKELLASLDNIDEKIEKQLEDPDPVKRARARRGKTRSTVVRMQHHATLEKVEESVRSGWVKTRMMLQKYVVYVQDLNDTIFTGSLQAQANEEAQENSEPGLLETLGTALFAWKSVGAFNDLSAIRKSLKK